MSGQTILPDHHAVVFRLMISAKKKWLKISAPNRLPEIIQGDEFKDGIKQLQNAA